MKLCQGDMWQVFGEADLFGITTNAKLRGDGALVMGRGIAAQAKSRYPELPYAWGREIQALQQYPHHLPEYGVLRRPGAKMFAFQVKYRWDRPAETALIGRSVRRMLDLFGDGPQVHLNFPGIGNGGLPRDMVLPLLEDLPDNYHIWEYA